MLAAVCRMAKPAGKKPKGGKAKKQRATEHKKRIKAASGAAAGGGGGGDDGGKDLGLAPAGKGGHQRNPKAFVFSGRGKAKRQAARSAEKDQRRMHGAASLLAAPNMLAACCASSSRGPAQGTALLSVTARPFNAPLLGLDDCHEALCCGRCGTRIWLPKCVAKVLLRCAALCEHHLPHPCLRSQHGSVAAQSR